MKNYEMCMGPVHGESPPGPDDWSFEGELWKKINLFGAVPLWETYRIFKERDSIEKDADIVMASVIVEVDEE